MATGAILVAAFAVGCDRPDRATSSGDTVRRDSADVEIVEHRTEAAATTWTVGAPAATVGAVEGDRALLFNGVGGGRFLPGGGFVLGDRGSGELRFFTSSGAHVATAGGRGEGPGEFQDIAGIDHHPGDSLLIFDRSLQRATVLDASGRMGRTVRLAGGTASAIRRVASLANGELVGRSSVLPPPDAHRPWTLWRDTLVILRFPAEGAGARVVARRPGDDRYTAFRGGGSTITVNNHPLGRISTVVAVGDSILYSDGSALGFEVLSRDGRHLSTVRLHVVGASTTPDLVDVIAGLRRDFLGADPDPERRTAIEEMFEELEWPRRLPAVADMVADRDGRVWIQAFAGPGEPTTRWHRFTMEGTYDGSLALPAGVRVLDGEGGRILVVGRSELGVERIQVLELT